VRRETEAAEQRRVEQEKREFNERMKEQKAQEERLKKVRCSFLHPTTQLGQAEATLMEKRQQLESMRIKREQEQRERDETARRMADEQRLAYLQKQEEAHQQLIAAELARHSREAQMKHEREMKLSAFSSMISTKRRLKV
jgi:hypothetical protein